MQALSMAVLSCSASNAAAFVPSGMIPISISTSGCNGVRSRCSAKGLVPGWIQRSEDGSRPRQDRSRRPLSKSDQADPVATVSSKRDECSIVPAVKKVPRVSQRIEQDGFFGKLKEPDGLRVRTGRKGDMMPVARLCVDTFRGPFEWWMRPLQLYQEVAFCGQITQRCGSILSNEIQHSIVVVEDTRTHEIVGFLEVGMLPRPTFSEPSEVGENERAMRDEGGGSNGVGTVAFEKSPDVAYLANVVVDRNQRRRGIGRVMINSAMEMVKELWPLEKRVYVAVEKRNEVAIAVYEALGFEITGLEDEMLARSRKRPSRIYFSKSLA